MKRLIGPVATGILVVGLSSFPASADETKQAAPEAKVAEPPQVDWEAVQKPKACDHEPSHDFRFCNSLATCAPVCRGATADRAKVAALVKLYVAKGVFDPEPTDLVDPVVAILHPLQVLAKRDGVKDCVLPEPKAALEKAANRANRQAVWADYQRCGIYFDSASEERLIAKGVIWGLAKAAIEAKKRGFVLNVGYMFRSVWGQFAKTCRHAAAKKEPPCDGKTLACPGGSNHGQGLAIDVAIARLDKRGRLATITPRVGKARSCADNAALVKRDKGLQALDATMFAAGWLKYCKELWHFEYSDGALGKNRVGGSN